MKKINVLVFGDSITYAVGDYEKGGWVARLRHLLEKDVTTYYDVFNLGIPGDTSSDVLNRFARELNDRFYDGELFIIFQVGGNDAASKMNIEKFKRNIQALNSMAQLYTKHVVFVGITPAVNVEAETRHNEVREYNDELGKEFDNAIRNQVASNVFNSNIRYIRTRDELTIADLYDGIHPDPEGHEKIANMVYNYIRHELNGKVKGKCCLCGGLILNHGNDPWPLSDKGRCCDTCNVTKVIQARIQGIGGKNEK